VRLAGDALVESGHQARLADPGLARDQDDLSFALPGAALAVQQEIDLILATDEACPTRWADRLEAALGSRHALNRPRGHRFGDALDAVPAEVTQPKQIAKQTPRGARHNDHSRIRQGLQPSRNVRRGADHRLIPQRALGAEIADHDQARRDADAHRKRFLRARLEAANGGNDIEPRPYGSLRVVLVRARIAEIGQYPVAAELGEEPVIGQHDTGAGGVIGVDHGSHVLRIESVRKGSRANQIADHHREVTTLGSRHARLPGLSVLPNSARHCRGSAGERRPNCLDEALAIPHRDPELLKITFCQFRQHIAVDCVVQEQRLIAFETEGSQPVAHVHVSAALIRTWLIVFFGGKVCILYWS
jgi:hypothetical protein